MNHNYLDLPNNSHSRNEQATRGSSKPGIQSPASPQIRVSAIHCVFDQATALSMLDWILGMEVCSISVQVQTKSPPQKPCTWHQLPEDEPPVDIMALEPSLVSLSVVTPESQAVFAVSMKDRVVDQYVQKVLNLGHTLIFKSIREPYIVLRGRGIIIPDTNIFDIQLAALGLSLGKFHYKYQTKITGDCFEESENKDRAQTLKLENASILSLCRKMRIDLRDIRKSLRSIELVGSEGVANFSKSQIYEEASTAVTHGSLYEPIVAELLDRDLLRHMVEIEFPFAIASAESSYYGVKICPNKSAMAIKGLQELVVGLEEKFRAEYNVINPNSDQEVRELFRSKRILEHFRARNASGYSFSSKSLERLKKLDPVVSLVAVYRKYSSRLSDKILRGQHVSLVDGRVHTQISPLGSDTGRATTSKPSLNSVGKVFRPMVVAEEGWGIGEADIAGHDVAVAAALSNDANLIDDYNSGDPYHAPSKAIFKTRLTTAQLAYSISEFKSDPFTSAYRDKTKIFFLGLLYNMGLKSVANLLDVSTPEAKELVEEFYKRYPTLKKYLDSERALGKARGYGMSMTGLKRYRPIQGPLKHWEKGWLMNMPIQSSASDLFKAIVIELTRIYRRYNAKLIVMPYDAIVFEAPKDVFEVVARITKEVMERMIRKFFPKLKGRVDLNISSPDCWNKDGKSDSIDEFLKNPIATALKQDIAVDLARILGDDQ